MKETKDTVTDKKVIDDINAAGAIDWAVQVEGGDRMEREKRGRKEGESRWEYTL